MFRIFCRTGVVLKTFLLIVKPIYLYELALTDEMDGFIFGVGPAGGENYLPQQKM
jgi:hypothetical protein